MTLVTMLGSQRARYGVAFELASNTSQRIGVITGVSELTGKRNFVIDTRRGSTVCQLIVVPR
jgi:hypothetical protein